MAISDRDRRIWERQVKALRAIELPEGAQVTGKARALLIEWANRDRRANGMSGLVNDEELYPEVGFHRIAVARGMAS